MFKVVKCSKTKTPCAESSFKNPTLYNPQLVYPLGGISYIRCVLIIIKIVIYITTP